MTDAPLPIWKIKYRNLSAPFGMGREGYVEVAAVSDVAAMASVRDELRAQGDNIEIIEARQM